MSSTNQTPANDSSSGWFPLTQQDLKDPGLHNLNWLLRRAFQRILQLFGPFAPVLLSSPQFKTVTTQQTQVPSNPQELLTKGVADQLYSAQAIRKALVTGSSGSPVTPGLSPTESVQRLPLGGNGSQLVLETNGVKNTDQNLLNLVQGSNITITSDSAGDVTINAGGLSFSVLQEVPAGAINGTNVSFTLSFTPNPAESLQLFLNGDAQNPFVPRYILSGNTIIYAQAPKVGDEHFAIYFH